MRWLLVAFVALTVTALEGLAVMTAVGATGTLMLASALVLHSLATVLCAGLARLRRPDLSDVERDLVVLCAWFVPVLGPLMAWWMPRPQVHEVVVTAHEMFERYEQMAKPLAPDFERTLFTGDAERDVARELDVEGYTQVLRRGSIVQKRGALHRLAASGRKEHLGLLRRSLSDASHEVRLYAYAELARLIAPLEAKLALHDLEHRARGTDPQAALELARAHHDLAASGLLEQDLAEHHLRTAARFTAMARELGAVPAEAQRLEALVLTELRDFAGALERLNGLDGEHGDAELHRIRAEVAYAGGNLALAREAGLKLRQLGISVPAWLEALEVNDSAEVTA